jgi:hypothetical protein
MAYSVLERRATLVTVGVLVALAGVAWWRTIGHAGDMEMMVQGFVWAVPPCPSTWG